MNGCHIEFGTLKTSVICTGAPSCLEIVGFIPSNISREYETISSVKIDPSSFLSRLAPHMIYQQKDALLFSASQDYILRCISERPNEYSLLLCLPKTPIFNGNIKSFNYSKLSLEIGKK